MRKKQVVTATGISRVISKLAFNPTAPGPLRILASVENPSYYKDQALVEIQSMNPANFNEKVILICRLLIIYMIRQAHYDDTLASLPPRERKLAEIIQNRPYMKPAEYNQQIKNLLDSAETGDDATFAKRMDEILGPKTTPAETIKKLTLLDQLPISRQQELDPSADAMNDPNIGDPRG